MSTSCFSINLFSSDEYKSQLERETGENTVESMSCENMYEEEKETRKFVKSVAHLSQ